MKILLVDNYDSFTFNLSQLLKEAGAGQVYIEKNDQIDFESADGYDAFVISPGPGLPVDSGIVCDLIRHFSDSKRIFGVCLGMQAIAEVFGGSLYQTGEILHGEQATINPTLPVDQCFRGLEQRFKAGLYHSWAVDKETVPGCLRITAFDERGVIMGLRHNTMDICGVQFHPESFLTPVGKLIFKNWLNAQR